MKTNFVILMAALAVAVLLAEAMVRWWIPVSNVRYYYNSQTGTTLAPNSRMRWVSAGSYDNIVETNSLGFHDKEHKWKKKTTAFRIIALGDSYLEGLQVPVASLFSQKLEKRLEDSHGHEMVEVINLGLSGRGPAQHYRILETIGGKLNPDLVILGVTVSNDFRDSSPIFNPAPYKPIYTVNEKNNEITLTRFQVPSIFSIQSLLQRSALAYAIVHLSSRFGAFHDALIKIGLLPKTTPPTQVDVASVEDEKIPFGYQIYLQDPPNDWKEAKKITLRMISEINRLAMNQGASLIVFAVPADEVIKLSEEDFKRSQTADSIDFTLPYRELEAFLSLENIAYVDLVAPFRQNFQETGEMLRWEYDGHWNEGGHELAAQVLAQTVSVAITDSKKP